MNTKEALNIVLFLAVRHSEEHDEKDREALDSIDALYENMPEDFNEYDM